MHLARANDEVARARNGGDLQQLGARKNLADRVFGIAKAKHPRRGISRRRPQRFDRQIPSAVISQAQIDIDPPPSAHLRRVSKHMINRARSQNRIAAIAGDSASGVNRRPQTGRKNNPIGIDPPTITARKPAANGFEQRLVRLGVAENAVRRALSRRLQNRRRDREIHIGDPQRQNVAPAITPPFDAVAAVARGRRIER